MTSIYIQSKAALQVISSIPKRPSIDIYPTALSCYHQKTKTGLSTELNATDHLPHVKHHKRTKTSNVIDTNLSSLQSQPSCSWPVPFFSHFSSVLERWFWSLLIRGSKLKNSSTKWQSPWRIVQLNRRIILSLQDDMICPSVMIICSYTWIFCLFICASLSLFHSPRHNSKKAFSLHAGALSLWHSLPQ